MLKTDLGQLSGKKEFFIVLVFSLLILLIVLSRTELLTMDHPRFELSNDHHKYIIMARDNPYDFHIAPYCWRIAFPTLVKLLPFNLQTSFLLTTLSFLWFTGVAVYYTLKKFGFEQIYAFIGVMFFYSLSWAVKWVIHDFWLIDAMGFFFLTMLFYALEAKNDKLFIVMLFLGVMVKESILFTAPLYYTMNTEKIINFKLMGKTALYALPAVVALLVIRYFIPGLNTDAGYLATLGDQYKIVQDGKSDYGYVQFFLMMGKYRLETFGLSAISEYSEETFGLALVLLPLLALKKNLQHTIRFSPFIVLVYFSLFFANNTERLLVAAFPALLIMAMTGVKTVSEKIHFIKPYYFAILAAFLIGYNMIGTNSFSTLCIKTVLRVISRQ